MTSNELITGLIDTICMAKRDLIIEIKEKLKTSDLCVSALEMIECDYDFDHVFINNGDLLEEVEYVYYDKTKDIVKVQTETSFYYPLHVLSIDSVVDVAVFVMQYEEFKSYNDAL